VACGGFFQDACEKNIISPSSLLWFNQRHIIIYVQGSLVFNSSFLAEQHFKVWKKNRIDSPSLQFTPLNPHVGWFKWVCLKGYNLQFQRRIPSRFPISVDFPFPRPSANPRWEFVEFQKTYMTPTWNPWFWTCFDLQQRFVTLDRGEASRFPAWGENRISKGSCGCWYGIAAIASSLLHSVSISKISKISSWFYSCVWIIIAYLGPLDTL
jgi:hypothetical protein